LERRRYSISVATEEFVKRISTALQKQAEREKRTTLQRKDMVAVVKRADEFLFLEDIIDMEQEEPAPRPRKTAAVKQAAKQAQDLASERTDL